MDVSEDPRSRFDWLVPVIVVAAVKIFAHVLPSERQGCALVRVRGAPGPHPVVQEPARGRSEEVLVLVLFPLKQKAGTRVTINLPNSERRRRRTHRAAFTLDFISGFSCRVTCAPPTILEPVFQSLYPGPGDPVVLRASQ